MLNYIWLGLMVAAVLLGGWNGHLDEVVKNAFDLAKAGVMDIALPLSAIMTVWLGVMRLAEKSGLVFLLARGLRPILCWLFPDVPVNTASIQLIPVTPIAILAAAGGKNPTAIVGTAFLATVIAQFTGITAAKILEKLPMFRPQPAAVSAIETKSEEVAPLPDVSEGSAPPPLPWMKRTLLALFCGCFAYFFVKIAFLMPQTGPVEGVVTRMVSAISIIAIPFFLSFFPLYAALHRVKVYEEFVEGAKEGFAVAIRIIPYLVTILTAVGMFRGAHGIELIAKWFKPALDFVGFPPELLSLAIMRPLSGSGSVALVSDVVKTYGPDSIYSMMAGTILGSTETTFYVIAVYFGSVGIRRTRHAVPVGLMADFAGIASSVAICKMMFGHR
jgi:spore maturation protein SpmB